MKALYVLSMALSASPALAQTIDTPPQLLESPELIYPEGAEGARATLDLVLELSPEGAVLTATVAGVEVEGGTDSGLEPLFVSAALRWVPTLRFSPARTAGQPVAVRVPFRLEFVPPAPVEPPEPVATRTLSGVVRAAGSRRRLPGVVVAVEDQAGDGFETLSDDGGGFSLEVPIEGAWQLVLESPGFVRLERSLEPWPTAPVDVYLVPGTDNPFDVTVRGQRAEREATRRTLDGEEAAKIAGTLGDPVLALENLPGVARTGATGGRPIRGSSPQDTGYFIEGIPTLFNTHVGGFRGVLPAQMVERIEFYPGVASVRYGRGMGGVVDMELATLDPDQLHGKLDVSLLDAGLYFELPLGEQLAVAVAGRRSYIDAVMEAAIPSDSDTQISIGPRWYDYQLLVSYRPSERHELRLFGVGANDALEVRVGDAADNGLEATTNLASTRTEYQRASLQSLYRGEIFTNDLRVGFGRDAGNSRAFGRVDVGFEFLQGYLRNESRLRLGRLEWVAGLDAIVRRSNYDVSAFRPRKEGEPPTVGDLDDQIYRAQGHVDDLRLAGYLEADWSVLDGLHVIPGIRVDRFGLSDAVRVDPRLVLRYSPWEPLTLTAGVGLVHQEPELDELVAPFGNPNLGPQRALHSSVGARWQIMPDLSAELTLFHKEMDELVRGIDGPAVYDNGGTGRAYGLELFVRKDLSHRLSGWLSYTLSRSERDLPGGGARLFDADQTHILALLARYELGDNWGVGARWRFVSGRPTTPLFEGSYYEAIDGYEARTGGINSERLSAFHSLDLRIDKTFYFDTWQLGAYLSVSNAYNRSNPEDLAYQFDHRVREEVPGLPILPILGLEAEF